MRDNRDHATLELPGLLPAASVIQNQKRAAAGRSRKIALQQVQLELLEPTDQSGLPVWRRDPNTDLTGLPIWASSDTC